MANMEHNCMLSLAEVTKMMYAVSTASRWPSHATANARH